MFLRLFQYLRPHLFAAPFGLAFAWLVKTVAASGGSCSFLCNPRVYVTMGLLGGLMGAQLYRSEHPLPPLPGEDADEAA